MNFRKLNFIEKFIHEKFSKSERELRTFSIFLVQRYALQT